MYTVLSQRIVTGRQRGLVIWLLLVYFGRIDGATSWLFIAARRDFASALSPVTTKLT
jgi:hypothetical protein